MLLVMGFGLMLAISCLLGLWALVRLIGQAGRYPRCRYDL
jgi:hypothetical protein